MPELDYYDPRSYTKKPDTNEPQDARLEDVESTDSKPAELPQIESFAELTKGQDFDGDLTQPVRPMRGVKHFEGAKYNVMPLIPEQPKASTDQKTEQKLQTPSKTWRQKIRDFFSRSPKKATVDHQE